MIIYSVTVSIDKTIEAEWLEWMLDKHIPDVMNTGYFVENTVQRLLDPVVDPRMQTYNFQYACESLAKLEAYQKNAAAALQAEHTERYKDRFVAFRTLLKQLS